MCKLGDVSQASSKENLILVLRVAYGSHFQVLSGHFPGSSWRNSAAFCQGFAWNFDFASALNRRQTWIGKAKLPVCNGTISRVSGIQRLFFSLVIYYFKSYEWNLRLVKAIAPFWISAAKRADTSILLQKLRQEPKVSREFDGCSYLLFGLYSHFKHLRVLGLKYVLNSTWRNDPIWLKFFKWVETTN